MSSKKKRNRASGMMAGALALCMLMSGCAPKDPGNDPVDGGDNETEITQPVTPNSNADQTSIAVKLGDATLDNQTLSYYYWDMYYYVGYVLGGLLDLSTPLEEQEYMDGESWHDFLLRMAIDNWVQAQALLKLGQDESFVMSDEYQEDYANTPTSLEADANEQGYESTDEYLKDNFGSFADMDSYMIYLEDAYYTSGYTKQVYDQIYDRISAAPATSFEDTINVRHILISNETEDAATVAQDIYDAWKSVGTEEEFANLANEHSTDPGSNTTGGLYENVTQGMMVDSFDQWVFDEARQIGDSGIVETTYGYHIMYFSGPGEPLAASIDTQVSEEYSAWLASLLADVDYTTYPENILIGGDLFTRLPNAET